MNKGISSRESSVEAFTYLSKDRMVTILGDPGKPEECVILGDLRREDSPYWHGELPCVMVKLSESARSHFKKPE